MHTVLVEHLLKINKESKNYENDLDETCFQHDMACGKIKA